LIIALLLLVAALCIRGPGLGKWCLTEDEYYYSQPVAFILEKGIPQFPGGGLYDRGFGLQYLTVIPAILFGKWEFAVRIVPLIFGALTVPLLFLLARRFLGTAPSILCAAILLVSSWHIEFSRFARFYAPFQFLFLLFVYSIYAGYIDGGDRKNRYRILAFVLGLLAISMDKYSIFLPVVLFATIFLLDETDGRTAASLAIQSAALVSINVAYTFSDFRFIGIDQPELPEGYIFEGGAAVVLPGAGLLGFLRGSILSASGYILVLAAAAYLFHRQYRECGNLWDRIALLAVLVLPLFHLYGVLTFLLIVLLINKKTVRRTFLEHRWAWILYLAGTFAYWACTASLSSNLDKILFFTVGYPPLKTAIIVPFWENAPLLGAFLIAVIVVATLHSLLGEQPLPQRFLLGVVLLLVFIMPVFNTPQKSTRYIFFFFPLVLVLAYAEAASLAEWAGGSIPEGRKRDVSGVVLALPIVLYAATDDFHARHILDVSSAQFNFRMGEYERYFRHWYQRADYEGPSRYVNSVYAAGDNVVTDLAVTTRYLEKPYRFYVHCMDSVRFPYHARNEGRTEKWTGKPLLSAEGELAAAVPEDPGHSLWLVTALKKGITSSFLRPRHNVQAIAEEYRLRADLVFKGVDGRVGVWKITRSRDES
jgi:asparagine N-glycosylation enzyme membrane subunit Stt3